MTAVAQLPTQPKRTLVAAMAERYSMDADKFAATLRATVMPKEHTIEEFASCLMVAHQYDLNPVIKQIYFMKARSGVIQPIVSVDGWAHIVNRHPQHDGMQFVDRLDDKGHLVSITCRINRKDRAHPIEVTEYMAECKGDTPAWKKTPARMLRHRAMIQCARYAYGIAGIMEPDEFEQWNGKGSPVAALVSEPEPERRKSSAEAKRDGSTETFNSIRGLIASAVSSEALREVRREHGAFWNEAPSRWAEILDADYDVQMDSCRAREGA